MELTDKEIHLLEQLSRDRRLYAECKGVELDTLQALGLLQWFDVRSSTTPFKEDPRPLFRLLRFTGRIDYFWVEAVENWRQLVGPEVSAKVDEIDEIEQAMTDGLLAATALVDQTGCGPRPIVRALAGAVSRPDAHGGCTRRSDDITGSAARQGQPQARLPGDEGAPHLAGGNWKSIGDTKWLIAGR